MAITEAAFLAANLAKTMSMQGVEYEAHHSRLFEFRLSDAAAKISLTPTQLAAYAGQYYSEELQVAYRVVLENGKLFMKYRQVINGELMPAAQDTFKLYGVVNIQFIRDNQNQIAGFVPQNGGAKNIRFSRM